MKMTVTSPCNGSRVISKKESSHSVLETLEAHSIEVEYQCRQGYCGSCRTRLLRGNVRYCTQPLAALQQGEILPCCCFPLNDIEIELNS